MDNRNSEVGRNTGMSDEIAKEERANFNRMLSLPNGEAQLKYSGETYSVTKRIANESAVQANFQSVDGQSAIDEQFKRDSAFALFHDKETPIFDVMRSDYVETIINRAIKANIKEVRFQFPNNFQIVVQLRK